MSGEYLTAFLMLDACGRITTMATLGESGRLFHCGEATDSFLIETAETNDSLNYCEHVIVILSGIVVVCHVCHYNIIIVKSQGVS